MGIAVFLLLLFFAWAVVLPIWGLVASSRAKVRARDAEEKLAERERTAKAFARAALALEWTGRWRAETPAAAPAASGRAATPAPVARTPEAVVEAVLAPEAVPPPQPVPSAAVAFPPAAPLPPAPEILPAAALAAAPPQEPAAPRGSGAETRAAVARYSAWREHVRPFLIENIGWFIGGFLIVAGSLYFLREAWGSFAQLGRHLLVVVTALAYAGGFVGVALWLKRAHGLETASRAMAYVGLALLPVAALAASGTFELRPLAWAVVAPAVVGAAYPLLYLAAGLLDRPLAAPLARGLAGLLALVALEPALAALSPQAALALPYLGWAILHASSSAPLRGTRAPAAAVLAFHLSALAYALLFVLGRAHALGAGALPLPAFYGPLAVLVSFTALRVDVELRARWGGQPEIDTAVVASFAAALAGVALAARAPSYLALSAALAAAHFAVGIAWYRRPLLLYFSLASAAASLLALLWRVRGQDLLPARAVALLAVAAGAEWLAARFQGRDEDRLTRAAARSSWILLAASAGVSLAAAYQGRRLAPAIVLGLAAALAALWHRRAPRQSTAWTGAAAFSAAAALAALRFGGAPALVEAAAVVGLVAIPFLRGSGGRLGASALVHCALALAAVGLAADGFQEADLIACAAIFAAGALALGNALAGLAASVSALAVLALRIGGPSALKDVPGPELRWAILPAAAIGLVLVLRLADRVSARPLPTPLPFPAPGLRAISDPLLACAALLTVALAARGVFSIDARGALLLAAGAACALGIAGSSGAAAWSAAAAGFAVVSGAWEGSQLLGSVLPAFAAGGAIAGAAALGAARTLRSRAGSHAESALDVATFALGGASALALGALAAGPADARLCLLALAVSAAALIALAAPARAAASWFGLVALGGAAATLPLAMGKPQTLVGPALAGLALLLVWIRFTLAEAPAWTQPLLRVGPPAAALAAVVANFAVPGPFLDWNRALCDGLLAAWLGSALFVEGGVLFLHLLLAALALGVVRARTLLGIVPSGWGTVIAAAALLGLAVALRKREKYANALLVWSALAIGYTCEWTLGAPRLRWSRMAAAALVAVPLAPHFFPLITSGAAVAALGVALLAALPPPLWTAATWPLGPAVLGLVLAFAAEPLGRVASRTYCAPAELAKSLRVAAVVLCTAAAGMTAYAVLAAALRLPGAGLDGPGALSALPLLAGGAALALVFRRLERAPPAAWPLALGVALAVLAVALPAASSWTPAGGALVLLAEAAVAAALAPRVEDLRWAGASLWAASLAATHFSPGEWTTAVALLGSAWFLREVPLPLELSAPTFGMLAAAGFGLAFGASRVPFLAASGVAAPLALLAAAAMLWHERRGSAANASALAAASAIALVLGSTGEPHARAAFLFGGAAMILLLCASRARSDARWAYAAAVPAVAAWAWARSALGILPGFEAADATAALSTAFALALLQAALQPPISTPLSHLAALLPAALLFVTPPASATPWAGGAAALYGLLAWLRQSRAAAYLAVALVNVALFSSWRARGLDDAQLYTVPLGLSLLAAAQISHGDLSRRQLSWLRGLGCLVLYAGTALQMLRFEGPAYPLILGGLALATVVAGVMLQIRSFALLGAATLVADVLANLIRASARSSRVMAVSATLTGFVILGAMIWLSVKREETLAVYRRLVRAMDDWE